MFRLTKLVLPTQRLCSATFRFIKPFSINVRNFGDESSGFSPRVRTDADRVEDMAMAESYDGFFPRLGTVLSVNDNAEEFEKIKKESVYSTSEPEEEFARPMLLYSDLQHPLVRKYGFDLPDFMVGAQHGFQLILNTLMGKNFHDFVSKTAKGEAMSAGAVEAEGLLRATLHPELYHHKARMVEQVSSQFAYSADNPARILYEDVAVSVTKMSLVRLTVDVVEEEETLGELGNGLFAVKLKKVKVGGAPADEATADPAAASKPETETKTGRSTEPVTSSDIDAETTGAASKATKPPEEVASSAGSTEGVKGSTGDVAAESEAAAEPAIEDALYNSDNLSAEYPVGSVVATAHAVVTAVYDSSKSSDQNLKFSEKFAHHVKFRACISGDVELEWKIIDMS